MTVAELATLETFLLIAGGLFAFRLTSWVARDGVRTAALMAAVAAWSILFGIIPFFAFAFVTRQERPLQGTPPQGWEAFVLNFVLFALFIAPVAGFIQGMRHWRRLGGRK